MKSNLLSFNYQHLKLIIFLGLTLFITTKSYTENEKSSKIPEVIIDGKVTEEEWGNSRIFKNFYITIPESESKDYDSTTVWVKQDKEAVYIALRMFPRGKVISKSLVRDRGVDEDNETIVTLDLENEQKNGFTFYFNYINNQRDYLIYNEKNLSQEWDWRWEVKSQMKNGMIESEVKIPVDKIQNKDLNQIGINVTIFAYRPDGTGYYYSLVPGNPLDYVRNTYKLDITPFEEKLDFKFGFTPFTVAERFNDKKFKTSFGGDLNTSLDKHTLKVTYNTDESTIEADPFQFAFYNEPIFLTEKRPFFSRDLDIYRTPVNLFYTRAIQNINYGLNYTYRSNVLKTGLAYIQEEKDPAGNKRKFFALRPTINTEKLDLGTTFIYSQDPSNNYQERILSLDALYKLPLRFRFRPQYATNFNGSVYNAHLYYEFDYTGGPYGDLIYRRFDENFNSLTMFNNYGNNNDEIIAALGYKWSFDRKFFSDFYMGTEYYKAKTLSNNFKFQEYNSIFSNFLIVNWLRYSNSFEYNRPDDLVLDQILNRKNFLQQHTIKFIFGSYSTEFGYYFGDYFGSYLKNPSVTTDLILFDRMNVNLTYNYRSFFNIKQSIFRTKIDYKIIEKLYLRTFFQKDTYTKLALWNTLLQYEFFAGSNIYLVFNLEGPQLQRTGRYFKVGYEFYF